MSGQSRELPPVDINFSSGFKRLRQRSYAREVLKMIQAGIPRQDMTASLTSQQIKTGFAGLRRNGILPRPTREESVSAQRLGQRSRHRDPSPGTKMAVVLDAIRRGIPQADIAEKTGLTKTQVVSAVGQLRRTERLQRADPEVLKRQRVESIRKAKDSIWPLVEKYARKRMAPREIQVAARLESGTELNAVQIGWVVGKARRRSLELPLYTSEERLDAKRVAYDSREDIQERVKGWLQVATILQRKNLQEVPERRQEWKMLIEFYERVEKGQIDAEFTARVKTSFSQEDLKRLQLCTTALYEGAKVTKNRAKIIILFQKGATITEICEEVGLSVQAVKEIVVAVRTSKQVNGWIRIGEDFEIETADHELERSKNRERVRSGVIFSRDGYD